MLVINRDHREREETSWCRIAVDQTIPLPISYCSVIQGYHTVTTLLSIDAETRKSYLPVHSFPTESPSSNEAELYRTPLDENIP
jgi:hypothetical protein